MTDDCTVRINLRDTFFIGGIPELIGYKPEQNPAQKSDFKGHEFVGVFHLAVGVSSTEKSG